MGFNGESARTAVGSRSPVCSDAIMPFTRIDGTISILGSAPDGDSVHFTPLRPDAWKTAHLKVRANAAGRVQLRLDAIDALETHYTPPGGGLGVLHQPLPLAHAAAERLLDLLGFSNVVRAPDERVMGATPSSVAATVMTKGVDVNGRCIALLYPGGADVPGADGGSVRLEASALASSANLVLLEEGLVYPTFYSGLYVDLRAAFTEASTTARNASRGVWPEDRTVSGVAVTGLATLSDQAVLLPKLFRRLAEYLTLGGPPSVAAPDLSGFLAFLDAHGDRVLVLSQGQVTGFASVVSVEGDVVRLTQLPESLVFFEA